MKSWLHNDGIEMHSTHNKEKPVLINVSAFIRPLKNTIYKHMTEVSKNVYIDKLDRIVDKYNTTCHRTINVKPVNVKPRTYVDYVVEHNDKDPEFKVGDHIRILKYKNSFAKYYTRIWLEKVFVIRKVKKCVPSTYISNPQ